MLLVFLAVFRKINYPIRVGGLLAVGYAAAVANLVISGIRGVGSLYLIMVSVIALLLIGKWASIIVSAISLLLLTALAILINRGVVIQDSQLLGTASSSVWSGLSTVLMSLAIVEILLLQFYRFQEDVILSERQGHEELLHALALLEENNLRLEQQVTERTSELQQSNKIQAALYQIADTTSSAHDIEEFYKRIHKIVGGLMCANNFLIALYEESTDLFSYPYYVDESGETFPTRLMGNSRNLTSYINRTGKTIKQGQEEFHTIEASGEYRTEGNPNEDGVGAPLVVDGKIIGAIYIQSYDKDIHYSEKDDEILAFVAHHIATALSRFRAAELERQRANERATLYSV